MAAAPQVTYPRIVCDPRIQGGEPVVAGTRVPVSAIVVTWREEQNIPALLAAYPRLTPADIEQALAYYEAHRDEMDAIIQAQLAED